MAPTFEIEGILDFACSIIHRFLQMTTDSVTSWTPWECNEVGTKKKLLPDSRVVISERTLRTGPADAALKRRGLAAELAGLVTTPDKITKALAEDPADSRSATKTMSELQKQLQQVRAAHTELRRGCWWNKGGKGSLEAGGARARSLNVEVAREGREAPCQQDSTPDGKRTCSAFTLDKWRRKNQQAGTCARALGATKPTQPRQEHESSWLPDECE